jgi:hypothetical protein
VTAVASVTARLTEAHRLAQLRLAAANVVQMRALWPLLDRENLDATFDRWLTATVPVINAGRGASSRLAANYYTTHRSLSLGVAAAPFTPTVPIALTTERIAGALLVAGPAAVKNSLTRGETLDRAMAGAEANSARVAVYYTSQAGRDTITESVAADPKALGWARATSGESCAFCLMLAGRGPVYSETGVDFEAHPGCACEPEPAYSRDQAWPAGSQEAKQMWRDATSGLGRGDDPLNAFRQHLAQR